MIPAVRRVHPGFVLRSRGVLGPEWALQQQGFDYCYDKRLYDRLVAGQAGAVYGHLTAEVAYQQRLVRFIENHDEPRAAATFSGEQLRAAAVTTLGQTGARLVHEGQLEGRTVHLPVFLARRPDEPADAELKAFYEQLLTALADDVFRDGEWHLGARSGWDANDDWENLVAWGWRGGPANSWSSIWAAPRRRGTSRSTGTTCAVAPGSSTTRPPVSATSAAATTSATGSTSPLAHGRGTSSP